MNSEEMSQQTAAERAWKAAATAQEYAERESFSNVLMWSEVARSWAAVAGQLEYVTVTVERDARDLPDDDCLRLTEGAEYCPAAGSPRCVSCVWRPADDAPDKAAATCRHCPEPTTGPVACTGECGIPSRPIPSGAPAGRMIHVCGPGCGTACIRPDTFGYQRPDGHRNPDHAALDEPTEPVPTVLPQRDPGATIVLPVLCHCASQPHAHPYAAGCRQ